MYKVNGADLTTLFNPYSSGGATAKLTGYKINGVDLSNTFAVYTGGTKAAATNYIINNGNYINQDLNQIFAPYTTLTWVLGSTQTYNPSSSINLASSAYITTNNNVNSIVFSTSNPSYVQLSGTNNSTCKFVYPGTANITASLNGTTATIGITVQPYVQETTGPDPTYLYFYGYPSGGSIAPTTPDTNPQGYFSQVSINSSTGLISLTYSVNTSAASAGFFYIVNQISILGYNGWGPGN